MIILRLSWLYTAFYTFTNQDLLLLLDQLGLKTKVERGNRVFPVSDKSSDVIKALEKHLNNNNVKRLTGEAVRLITEENRVTGVEIFCPVTKSFWQQAACHILPPALRETATGLPGIWDILLFRPSPPWFPWSLQKTGRHRLRVCLLKTYP